ncbi:BAH domain-containing protein/Med26 domain-containing protein [Cephalotus follicularis]|uniref:BAH domain-containing protein/Med26 domain-containing protein n=1 Tax=Cephalotus follicularis TaxID=3775 RepID=A0A1Q3CL89_CEPFO|nr:BAH domain-containing protein/Med26 domain-containing protein [Cephalotus follicularis]
MHGRGRGGGGGSEQERKPKRHMWTEPTRVSPNAPCLATSDGSNSPSSSASLNSFSKGGRKISVGDCALFKPPQDSPPFIGIIRWLSSGKENKLKLGVNWLYRPVEVKLGKGILLEAAPNEIFYSFHKDEIPAASLLHPCKVVFLPKGVDLPSGFCSFVCRRVYDITNKCLWWLTDQDYINERQEEVDQLIIKTRIEMHATVQPGGRSPKPLNGPTSTSQLKPGSDSVQNSASSFPSQVKGKKRERGDQGSEPIKRERFTKFDEGDSGHSRPESNLKSEIAKITDKGGLADSAGVEKLVQLMLPERNERKIDLIGRSMLAGVIAVTDKLDCLSRFVQLRGLPVFDEWLQEVHKGKIGDGSSPKDSDKCTEDFLLVLLRALDKLPVNLHALQMCNIGKSVNHLRSHKNLEIQKKARSLVDTWKKRVEAEMDAKSGSNQAVTWPAKPRLPEVSHGGNRNSGGSTEVATKSSVTQLSASKTASVKLVPGEATTKSASLSPAPLKSAPPGFASVSTNVKDGQTRNAAVSGASDLLMATAKDEKSSSSSQSHNNSQSCSSDHGKAGGSGKEDARSSTAGSMTVNKTSGGSSRPRKSTNGFFGPALSGSQRETGSSRTSLQRNPASEKISQSSLTCEKTADVPLIEGNGHKLIVKIPNRGRSPAQSASGGSFEDPSVMNSRASSPLLSEKHDQFDRNLKDKSDACRANITSDVNTESWQSNDFKDVLTGYDEGDGSPADVLDEERFKTGDDSRKIAEVSKAASSSSGNELKSGKLLEASYSSINALIESCAKYSEVNASMSVGDDVGMNLLASVAAGEMSKSDMVSPTDSPQRNGHVVEYSCTGDDLAPKSSPRNDLAHDPNLCIDGGHDEPGKNGGNTGTLAKNSDGKTPSLLIQEKSMGELNALRNSSSVDLQQSMNRCLETNVQSKDVVIATGSVPLPSAGSVEMTSDGQGDEELKENKAGGGVNADGIPDSKEKLSSLLAKDDNVSHVEVETEDVEGSSSRPSRETNVEKTKIISGGLNSSVQTEQKLPAMMLDSEFVKGSDGEVPLHSGKDLVPETVDEAKAEKLDEENSRSDVSLTKKRKCELESNATITCEDRMAAKDSHMEENLENKVNGPAPSMVSPSFPVQETEQKVKSRGSKSSAIEAEEAEECTSTTADDSLSGAGWSDVDTKVGFDLNEGFNADDGKYGEPNNLTAPGSSAAVQFMSPLPFSSSVSSGLPASITVAAAAKGPFVPPDDLLRNKRELGWKGSAATSAFRPAEPRKALEMPLGTTNVSLPDVTTEKSNRPLLDFDLNVPDERILEDLTSGSATRDTGSVPDLANNCDLAHDQLMGSSPVRSSGGIGLDLNKVDEPSDMGNHFTSSSCRLDIPLRPVKSSSGSFLNGETSVCRDFDLNDGPVVDEVSAEPSPFSQLARTNMLSQPTVCGLRMNNPETGNFSSWFSPPSTYSAVTIPSILPDSGEQPFPIVPTGGPQRVLAPHSGSTPFSPDIYRGPVLSSSPAVPFPSSPFQYPVFPFGSSFAMPSATFSGGSTTYMDSVSGGRLCFPPAHSQLLGPSGAVPSHYQRPYIVSLPDGSNIGGIESSRKWGVRQGLDLNAGPGGPDVDVRDETSALALRQLSVASSQAVAEEQARIFQVPGAVLKRKDPEGGWDGYKQSTWQ